LYRAWLRYKKYLSSAPLAAPFPDSEGPERSYWQSITDRWQTQSAPHPFVLNKCDIIVLMAFDHKAFTDKLRALYAAKMIERLPGVRFRTAAKGSVLDEPTSSPLFVNLDSFLKPDGNIREDDLAEHLATGLSEVPIAFAKAELDKGPGQLWIVHEPQDLPETFGCALVHVTKVRGIELFGQAWYDTEKLKTKYLAKTVWTIERSGEATKG